MRARLDRDIASDASKGPFAGDMVAAIAAATALERDMAEEGVTALLKKEQTMAEQALPVAAREREERLEHAGVAFEPQYVPLPPILFCVSRW